MSLNKLPPSFRRIELQLAREPGHPAGDAEERYVLIAPLDDAGRIDPEAWRAHRQACRVVREHDGETAVGHLVHGPGGSWRIEYDVSGGAEAERGYKLDSEQLQTGECVSLLRRDGPHTYRVTSVTPVP